MNDKKPLIDPVDITLENEEIKLILKSLQKCIPEVDDQDKIFNLVEYLKYKIKDERKLG